MSFGHLKSARKAKESHSFVKPEPTAPSVTVTSGTNGPSTLLLDTNVSIPLGDDGVVDASAPTEGATTVDDTQASAVDIESTEAQFPPVSGTGKVTSRRVSLHGCHAAIPPTLEIRESNPNGRGIYVKSPLPAGAIVLSITPHVSVLSTFYLDQYCSACAGPAPESALKRCPKCKTVWYCNSECQNRDWACHKRECSALRRWAAASPSDRGAIPGEAVRCLGRILWGSQKEGFDSVWAKEVRMMHSNRSSLQPSGYESHTYLAHSLVRYLGVSGPQELGSYGLTSAGDLIDLLSRFTTNTLTLTTPSLSPIGICVAPIVAFANHSCDPNAVIVFPRLSSASATMEPLLHLVALRDIAPGKEVRISYVDTTLPQALRQKALKEVYNFTCQCTLCVRAQSVDPREALWCPQGCGGVCPFPTEENGLTRCVKCNSAIGNTGAVLDALRVGQEALDKASSLQFKEPVRAKQLSTNIIPILVSAGLAPSSHPLLALTRLHQELLIESLSSSLSQDTLDEAIRAAAKYSAGLQSLLPKGHPVRAVAFGELGKLLAVDEPDPPSASEPTAAGTFPPSGSARLKLAYQSLVRAHEEVLIGFGKADGGGMLGREIRDAIVRFEQELDVWKTGIRNVLEDSATGRGVSSSSK